jgi:hypothetical protein
MNGTEVATENIKAGTYQIDPVVNLIDPASYQIQVVRGMLTVSPDELTVTVQNKSIVYGSAATGFEFSVAGFNTGDNAENVLAAPIQFIITNSNGQVMSAAVLPVGTYMVEAAISLQQPASYVVNKVNGILVVTKASLNVKADNKVIYKGDPLPVYTSTITGFVNGGANSILSGPNYTLAPVYCGVAGVYTIKPSGLVLVTPNNYSIGYTNGTLYVNPKGQGARKVKTQLLCVEE